MNQRLTPPRRAWRFALGPACAAAALALFVSGAAFAQQQAAPADPGAANNGANNAAANAKTAPTEGKPAPAEVEREATIIGMIFDSGPLGWVFMAVLGLFSIAGAAIVLERLVNLKSDKVIPPDFVSGLDKLIASQEDQPEEFRQLCQASASPIANILNAGLLRSGRPLPEVEKSMEDAAVREMAEVRSRVRPLSVIGSVAPLVGLLGTVVGMIMAFFQASQAGLGNDKAELLAQGIYLALITTAAGLSIAIPSMLFAAMFNSRADRYFREIDERLMVAMPCLAKMESREALTAPEAPASQLVAARAK